MSPPVKPAMPRTLRPANLLQSCACSAVSIGSTAFESTSQSRKTRIPVASADRPERAFALRPCIRATGRPRKMVSPAIAPSRRISGVLIVVRAPLHAAPGAI
jgi:hypothetical protein